MSGSLFNIPVVSLRDNRQIALALEPVINPHNLKIIGWWCNETGTTGNHVLLSDDVRESNNHGMEVNDEQALISPEDLVRQKEILDAHFVLIGKVVKTKRQKIGKVQDFSYNDGLFVQKLYVEHSIVKVFSSEDTAIIDRTQILEVTDTYILVRDTEIKDTEEEASGATAPIPAS